MMFKTILGAILGSLITLGGFYLFTRRYLTSEWVKEVIFDVVDDLSSNEEYSKKLYMVGGVLGSGVRGGLGISKSVGKMKWQDIALELGKNYFDQFILKKDPDKPSVKSESFKF